MPLTFGELFAGIGGFGLGFERAGMECRWHVELDPYCQQVLKRHWPNVGRWDDVRTFPPDPAEDWEVDVLCGGFPCQDVSNAGKREGIDGEQSGLWREFHRIICVLRPGYVVIENVAALLVRGIDRVLGDLAASGYDAEWDCLPAAEFGAPHERDRVFIVAYAHGTRGPGLLASGNPGEAGQGRKGGTAFVQHCVSERLRTPFSAVGGPPLLCRTDDGVRNRIHRLQSLGNAIVPQVAHWIGRRIVDSETETQ